MDNVYILNNLRKGSLKVTITPAQHKTLTHLPKRPPVDLAFTDLTYKVQEGRKSRVLVALSALAYTAYAAQAPCVCTRNYKPVCGSDGVTYSNECLLNCQRYSSQNDITAVRNGPCDLPLPETCVCPFNYSPVCGSDSVTYPNSCSLRCSAQRIAGLEELYQGPCAPTPQEPPCTCPRERKPVCGSDGNTYSNSCLLNCATKDNSMLSIRHLGDCPDKVKVVDF